MKISTRLGLDHHTPTILKHMSMWASTLVHYWWKLRQEITQKRNVFLSKPKSESLNVGTVARGRGWASCQYQKCTMKVPTLEWNARSQAWASWQKLLLQLCQITHVSSSPHSRQILGIFWIRVTKLRSVRSDVWIPIRRIKYRLILNQLHKYIVSIFYRSSVKSI